MTDLRGIKRSFPGSPVPDGVTFGRRAPMRNRAMQDKLEKGECVDVRAVGDQIGTGLFKLRSFRPDIDYADAETESWIWSIGRHKQSGDVYASTDTRFYQNSDYECLWLR